MKVLITTVPFGETDSRPIDMLNAAGVDFVVNPFGRKLNQGDLESLIPDFHIIIAGTEPITHSVMDKARKLRLISRVGIGLDSVDLVEARRRGISVCYTPEAPSPAVAELTIGLMVSLLRKIQLSNVRIRDGGWQRFLGRRLSESVVGIIGVGRIGKRVIDHLSAFGCKKILVNDLVSTDLAGLNNLCEWSDKKTIYRRADVISLHLPLTLKTKNLVRKEQIESMKPETVLINTSRGGIVNENDLYEAMSKGHLGGAALDVFEQEPYHGPLKEIENIILTAHMGSMSKDCRAMMEIEATQEAIRYISGKPLKREVPEDEYHIQIQGF